MLDEIVTRRSIRKYKQKMVSREVIEQVLKAGMLAPSSKNRQPWKFVVVTGKAKEDMAEVFRKGIEREKRDPFLVDSVKYIGGAEYTLEIMRQAPVVIFVANTLGVGFEQELTIDERVSEICNSQSIGAAIENMTLTAVQLGLGSLWICDTYFAQKELNEWLDTDGVLCAALAVGYADEMPLARPRKKIEDVVEWRSDDRSV